MVRVCCYQGCRSDSRKLKNKDVWFLSFPKPSNNYEKCLRWTKICRPNDDPEIFMQKITFNTHICSLHFFGGKGPRRTRPDPMAMLPDFQVPANASSAHEIILPVAWLVERSENESVIFYKKRQSAIILELTVQDDFTYTLKILGCSAKDDVLNILGLVSNVHELAKLLNELNKFIICSGNSEEHLLNGFKNSNLSKGRYCEIAKAVFSIHCKQIAPKLKCLNCITFRSTLRAAARRAKRGPKSISKITHSELISKAKLLKTKHKKEVSHLSKVVKKLRKENTIGETSTSAKNRKENIGDVEEPGFRHLFLREQCKMRNTKTNGRRWHPDVVNWFRHIKNESPDAFRALNKTGALVIPSMKTLNSLRHFQTTTPGFQAEVFEDMVESSKLAELKEHQKYFCLVLDEISVREDLVDDTKTRVDLEDEPSDMFDKETNSIGNATNVNHILQFVVSGITSNFRYLFAHFPTDILSTKDLHGLIWQGVKLLEGYGFRILAIIGDEGSVCRKYFKLCPLSVDNNTAIHHCTKNIYAVDEERDIYFIYDPVHLIKCVRNCFSTSSYAKRKSSRLLWNNDEDIIWNTILKTYQKDVVGPVRLLHKLTYNHVRLSPFLKTKVSYAVQVLSSSMAAAIERDSENAHPETVNFVWTFNRFFDVLSSRSSDGVSKSNEDLVPYRSVDDKRLEWLELDFLNYLGEWEMNVANRPGTFSKRERDKMLLSKNIHLGLRITVLSISKVVKILLNQGAQFILTTRLSKNPLE